VATGNACSTLHICSWRWRVVSDIAGIVGITTGNYRGSDRTSDRRREKGRGNDGRRRRCNDGRRRRGNDGRGRRRRRRRRKPYCRTILDRSDCKTWILTQISYSGGRFSVHLLLLTKDRLCR
jgi:hypothetical protein